MIEFSSIIEKYGRKGEKTGWTYIYVPVDITEKLNGKSKKAFRVKGWIDKTRIEQIALIPIGRGEYILTLNLEIRKKLKKVVGEKVICKLEKDESDKIIDDDFLECLKDDKGASSFFSTLTKSHQNYFSNWISSAKTENTKAKRIAESIEGLGMGLNYGEMIRHFKSKK
ncbi:MAG: YdeI/OmpD-associated family protein [Bacteroidia bacterium]